MSMPQIPEEKYRPDACEVMIDILKSIALEETALAHILNADGEKNQLVIKKMQCDLRDKSLQELHYCIKQTERILNTVMMKEWLLLKKMETLSEMKDLFCFCECKKNPPCSPPKCPRV